MYKIYWSIFDLSVLYLRMVLTVRSKQNNHDYTKMKTKNKRTRGLERTHTLLLETTTIFCETCDIYYNHLMKMGVSKFTIRFSPEFERLHSLVR